MSNFNSRTIDGEVDVVVDNVGGGSTGEIIYQQAADTTGFIDPGVTGTVLTSNGLATKPTFQAVPIPASTANITGGTAGQVPVQSAPSTTTFIATAATGTVLTSTGVGSQPAFQALTKVPNVSGGTAGQVVVQSAPDTTTFIATAASGSVLTSTGVGSVPTFQAVGAAANLAGGSTGLVPYQTAASTTGFITPAAAGTVLTSNGAGSQPTFQVVPNDPATTIIGGTTNSVVFQSAPSVTGFVTAGSAGTVLTANSGSPPTFQSPGAASAVAGGSTGQVLYQTAASTTGFISPATSGTVLTSNGAGVASSFQALPSSVASISGGTTGQVLAQSGTSATTFISPGAAGTVLASTGVGALPVFQAPRAGNIDGGAAGTVVVQTATNTTGFITPGASGTVLTSNGTSSLPTYQTATAANISGGATGQVHVQTAANTTGFVTPGVAGTALVSNGVSSIPSFQPIGLYASGTFTPALLFLGGGGGISYNAQYGKWIRIGTFVSLYTNVEFTGTFNTGGGAAVLVSGIPNWAIMSPGGPPATTVGSIVFRGFTSFPTYQPGTGLEPTAVQTQDNYINIVKNADFSQNVSFSETVSQYRVITCSIQYNY